jgi:aspartate aminotransferase
MRLSKSYAMTGWRIGYAAGPAGLIAAINKLQSQMTSCPSSISQAAAAHALASEQSFVGESVKLYRERRDYACTRLNAVPHLRCLVPDGAFYLYPSCAAAIGKVTPEGKTIDSDLDFVLYLLDKGGGRIGPWRGLWAFALFSAFDRDVDGDDQTGVRPHREGLRRLALRLSEHP